MLRGVFLGLPVMLPGWHGAPVAAFTSGHGVGRWGLWCHGWNHGIRAQRLACLWRCGWPQFAACDGLDNAKRPGWIMAAHGCVALVVYIYFDNVATGCKASIGRATGSSCEFLSG